MHPSSTKGLLNRGVEAMRVNGPVTNREVEMRDGQLLVSQTDSGGKIVFVNEAFVEISGFSEAELVGSPHNIVRHPDMPKEAFHDLWNTIKSGEPWDGRVKNRTKTGDFYWSMPTSPRGRERQGDRTHLHPKQAKPPTG